MYSKRRLAHHLGKETLVAASQTQPKRDSPIRSYTERSNGREISVSLYDSALTQAAYGRPRSVTPTLKTSASPIVKEVKTVNGQPLTVTLYDSALSASAYGAPALGDLFNDVMGTVVPGWDKRPDWMKNIRVKPDPAKLLQAAAKVVPPRKVGAVLDAGQQAGINLFYQSPVGSVPITSGTVQGLYSGLPIFAQAKSAFESIPGWVWLGGGGLILAMVVMRR